MIDLDFRNLDGSINSHIRQLYGWDDGSSYSDWSEGYGPG